MVNKVINHQDKTHCIVFLFVPVIQLSEQK